MRSVSLVVADIFHLSLSLLPETQHLSVGQVFKIPLLAAILPRCSKVGDSRRQKIAFLHISNVSFFHYKIHHNDKFGGYS